MGMSASVFLDDEPVLCDAEGQNVVPSDRGGLAGATIEQAFVRKVQRAGVYLLQRGTGSRPPATGSRAPSATAFDCATR